MERWYKISRLYRITHWHPQLGRQINWAGYAPHCDISSEIFWRNNDNRQNPREVRVRRREEIQIPLGDIDLSHISNDIIEAMSDLLLLDIFTVIECDILRVITDLFPTRMVMAKGMRKSYVSHNTSGIT